MRRRAGESFQIGPDIEIEILEISPTRVKIGVTAPATVAIIRKEIVLTRAENLTASLPAPPESIAWLTERLNRAGHRPTADPPPQTNSTQFDPTRQKY
jgi:carbon storage regulator